MIQTMGMQPCEGTEAVPPNARSHTVLLSGTFVGNQVRGATWGRKGRGINASRLRGIQCLLFLQFVSHS